MVSDTVSLLPVCPRPFTASVHLSAEEEAVSLLQIASQRELALLPLLDRVEVRPARRLDGIDELRGSGAGQERGRDGQADVLLHNAAEGAHHPVPERVPARAAGGHLEELEALVPGTTGDARGVTAVLFR